MTEKGKIDHLYQQQRSISKELLLEAIEKYPILKKNTALRQLYFHLGMNRFFLDQRYGLHAMPYQVLSKMMKRKYQNTREFLDDYHDKIDPIFDYLDYFHQKERCRLIIKQGIGPLIDDFFVQQERIYIETMTMVTKSSKIQNARKLKQAAEKLTWNYKDAERIAHYHLEHSFSVYTNMVEQNFQEAMKVAATSYPDQIEILMKIWDMPMPFYYPTSKSLSPRLFAQGLQFLKKELRKILCQGWIEIDLKNCHLAIVAMLFSIQPLQEFLKTGRSIWQELLDYMGIAPEQRSLAKGMIKEAVYSIVFGKREHALEYDLEKHLAEADILWKKDFNTHPLIKITLDAIKDAKNNIQQNKGMQGAYGWMNLESNQDIDTFLACVVQTYELKLIMPIYEIAIKEKKQHNSDFLIPLHQHDGVSLLLLPHANKTNVLSRITKGVNTQAMELGILTTLVEA